MNANNRLVQILPLIALAGVISLFWSYTSDAEDGALTKAQEEQVEAVITRYLEENPGAIVKALENFQRQEFENQKLAANKKIQEKANELNGPDVISIGPDDADVTVVEFFDYNCGYCKRALPDIQAILDQDDSVRFVFKEMPILSASSATAARWALAAHLQGKYFEYHSALMNHRGGKDTKSLKTLAEKAGLDAERMEKDAESPEVQALLEKHTGLARDIGLQGTPAFIINGQLYPGYLGPEGLKEAIRDARKDQG